MLDAITQAEAAHSAGPAEHVVARGETGQLPETDRAYVLIDAVLVAVGLAALYAGGETLVSGAERLSSKFGWSPLIIGLTFISFGTSAPELAVNLSAAWRGVPDLGLGNIVGSNIANLGLVLGTAAVIGPIPTGGRLARQALPIMLASAVLLTLLLADRSVSHLDGVLLVSCLLLFLAHAIYVHRDDGFEQPDEDAMASPAGPAIALLLTGFALLPVGSEMLVRGAVGIAERVGFSEAVIGLTLVAVGTSLPEIATSAVAAARGATALALGNIVGSNIWNVLCVLGLTALASPFPAGQMGWMPLIAMLAFSAAIWILSHRRAAITRVHGCVLLVGYASYSGLLLWQTAAS